MELTFGKLLRVAGQVITTTIISFVVLGALSILGVIEVRPAY